MTFAGGARDALTPWSITGGQVLGPDGWAPADITVVGERIVEVRGPDQETAWPSAAIGLALEGNKVIPGLVDGHVHFQGGGGYDGFSSRGPELSFSQLTTAGILTAVGAPGFDVVGRNVETLYAKAQSLTAEGLSAYMYVGGYDHSRGHLTGSLWRDAYLLPSVVGVKVALCESRAVPWPAGELVQLLRRLEWASASTGRGAVLHAHLGKRLDEAQVLRDLLEVAPSPRRVVVTHVNASRQHLELAVELAGLGAVVDLSSMMGGGSGDALLAADGLAWLLEQGVPSGQITMSTDGNGNAPAWAGTAWAPRKTHLETLWEQTRQAVERHAVPWHTALAAVTSTVAQVLGLAGKGRIAPGADADLVVLGEELTVDQVVAGGRLVVRDRAPVATGRFEVEE